MRSKACGSGCRADSAFGRVVEKSLQMLGVGDGEVVDISWKVDGSDSQVGVVGEVLFDAAGGSGSGSVGVEQQDETARMVRESLGGACVAGGDQRY